MTAGDFTMALEAIAASSGRSPLEILEFWLERSSIREYDGGLSRADAERLAVRDCQETFCSPPGVRSEPGARFSDATRLPALTDGTCQPVASGSKP